MSTQPLSLTALTVARCLSGLSLEEKIKIFSGHANEPPPFCIVHVFAQSFLKDIEHPYMSKSFLFSSYADFKTEVESDDPFGLVKSRNDVDYEWYHDVIDKWEASGKNKDIRQWFQHGHIRLEIYRDKNWIPSSQLLFIRLP